MDYLEIHRQSEEKIWDLIEMVREDVPINEYYFILFLFTVYNDNSHGNDFLSEFLNMDDSDLHEDLYEDLMFDSDLEQVVYAFNEIFKKIPPYKLRFILERVIEIPFNENVFDSIFLKIINAQGKLAGNYFQPEEITQFVMSISGINNPDFENNPVVYNPFAGLGSYGVLMPEKSSYYGQEVNLQTFAIGWLRIWRYKKYKSHYFECDNSITNWLFDPQYGHDNFDLIVSTPPFNLKVNTKDESSIRISVEKFLIENGLESLNEGGKLIYVIPVGFLFKSGKDGELRKSLIETGVLEAVILLPSNLFKNTAIPVCVLVLKHSYETNEFVKIVNASDFYYLDSLNNKKLDNKRLSELFNSTAVNEFQRFVTKEEIQNQNYNLNVPRYFTKEYPGVQLSSIIKIKRGESVQEGEKGRFVRIKDLRDDKLDHLLDVENLEVRELPRTAKRIEESSLLLSIRWKTLKPTYFKYEDCPIYISNNIIALTIDESKVDPFYLINELHADNIIKQAESYRTGTSIPYLKREDLLSIKVELPSIEEQRGKVKGLKELSKKIKLLEKERNALAHGKTIAEFDEFRSLKHSLGAPRQNILSNAKSLLRFFERNNSDAFIEVKQQFKNHYETELSEALLQIRDNINHISIILEKGEGGLILNNYKNEIIPLKDINTLLKNYSSNAYKFNIKYTPLKSEEIGKNALNCNITLFKILLDNIFSNANKYAFKEYTPRNEVVIELKPLEDFLEVVIKNNGLPFPKNFSKEKFITKFSTVDNKNGSGLGGYDINRIAKYFGVKEWQLLLDDTIYPVEFKFNFPLIMMENDK